jgi:hypothetical protein
MLFLPESLLQFRTVDHGTSLETIILFPHLGRRNGIIRGQIRFLLHHRCLREMALDQKQAKDMEDGEGYAGDFGEEIGQMKVRDRDNTCRILRLKLTAIALNWKPVSLRSPFLLAVIALSSVLIAILQLLLIQSTRDGGILFAKDVNSMPLASTFSYTYLPTIIAVIYAFLWNWIDLDIRRIEPFLQMAKDDGATGTNSLLLHYPVDFLASVPIKAVKQG